MSTDLYHANVAAPAPGAPLVFAFHGTGDDEHQFFDFARRIVPGAGVVSPRGDVSEAGAARFFRRAAEGVYDMADLARATGKMTRFIEAHRAAAPGHPVLAFGYSNGANILAAVAMQRPELFHKVALMHPLVTWDAEAPPGLVGLDVLITAGRNDPITPWARSEALVSWFRDGGAQIRTEVHDGGHEIRDGEVAALQAFLAGAPAL